MFCAGEGKGEQLERGDGRHEEVMVWNWKLANVRL